MDIVQDAVDKPLCIDSPNPRTIEAVFKYAKQPGIINSVSEESEDKCDIIYPLIQGNRLAGNCIDLVIVEESLQMCRQGSI